MDYDELLGVVRSEANRLRPKIRGTYLDVEDLEQEGWIAVARAQQSKTFGGGVRLKARWAMLDAIRRALPMTRRNAQRPITILSLEMITAAEADGDTVTLLDHIDLATWDERGPLPMWELEELAGKNLDEREYEIVMLSSRGQSLAQIAARFGVTESRISQLWWRAVEKIKVRAGLAVA